jgi:hypothetical protein
MEMFVNHWKDIYDIYNITVIESLLGPLHWQENNIKVDHTKIGFCDFSWI